MTGICYFLILFYVLFFYHLREYATSSKRGRPRKNISDLAFPEKPPDGAGAESMKVYKTKMTQRLKYIKSQMRLEGMSDAEISKDINSRL